MDKFLPEPNPNVYPSTETHAAAYVAHPEFHETWKRKYKK